MNRDHLYVGAHWGDRAEGPESAAARLTAMLTALAPLGPGFADWAVGEGEPLPTGDALVAWFADAFDPAKTERPTTLGAHVWLVSAGGTDPRALEAQLTVGLHAGVPALTNAVVLRPSTSGGLEVLPDVATDALLALVEAWEPDWAVLTSGALRAEVTPGLDRTRGFVPGAVSWLSDGLVDGAIRTGFGSLDAARRADGWLLDLRDPSGVIRADAVVEAGLTLIAAGL